MSSGKSGVILQLEFVVWRMMASAFVIASPGMMLVPTAPVRPYQVMISSGNLCHGESSDQTTDLGTVTGMRFVPLLGRPRMDARLNDGQRCEREHRPCDVTVPANPRTYFVFIQPRFLFRLLEALCNRPATAGNMNQCKMYYD